LSTRIYGTIKFAGKGFYFATRDDDHDHIFVGTKALARSGIQSLEVGDRIACDAVPSQKLAGPI